MNILITTNISDEKYTPYVLNMYKTYLDVDEFERYYSFKDKSRQMAFLIARGELKSKIGGILHKDPSDVKIRCNPNGKPYIDDGVFCSISHSVNLVGIIISSRPVGIDIEAKKDRNFSKISRRIFDSQIDDIDNFYKAWTTHEAVVKCEGIALLSKIDMTLDENNNQIKVPGYDIIHTSFEDAVMTIVYRNSK